MTALPRLIRQNVAVGILCVAGVVAAGLFLAQLWWAPLGGVVFGKALATTVIVAIMVGFVAAVDIELTLGRARLLLLLLIALSFAAGGLSIAQMWWTVLDWENFGKIMLTLGIFIALDAFFMAVSEDFGTTRQLKDDKYID